MDFGVQGRATPRSYHRHLPGSAYRPQSSKSQINPITGEEIDLRTPRQNAQPNKESTATENGVSDYIPSLDLKYLKDDDVKSGAIDIDLKDYSLDSPDSTSTVSWGTGRSARTTDWVQGSYKQPATVKFSERPNGVPGLHLTNHKPASARKPREPSAWDKAPVPDNVAAPSARYQEMYQQYADEMKQSYKTFTNKSKTQQEEVQEAVQRIKQSQKVCSEKEKKKTEDVLDKEDIVKDSWKKDRYTHKQLAKKQDIEDLIENNKKHKLVETVMIDQLSRAVISNPEQNHRTPREPLSSARKGRGSNRFLHSSKVSTSTSATENLLSKRVRFGARILTTNNHDAMRELTGFFFNVDKTITVYEFRQFGKSAKAMPFIYRGQYTHKYGPKKGLPYSLSDICSGSNIVISTEGQLALTDNLAESDNITLRVTDVDDMEKQLLDDGSDSEETFCRLEEENREFLFMIQDLVQNKIKKRGIKTVTGLNRIYRKMDQYNTGILDQYDLEKGLKMLRIDLDTEKLDAVFEILDPTGDKLLCYKDYIRAVVGEMNEYRAALVRKAFYKLDGNKKGLIHLSDVRKFFNTNSKYKPNNDDSHVSSIQAFLEAVREDEQRETVSYLEFEEYYQGLSLGVDSDEDFANVLRNTWNI